MNFNNFIIPVVLCISGFIPAKSHNIVDKPGMKIVCYYDSTAINRVGQGRFPPELLDTHLCTHLMYAFANVSELHLLVSAIPKIDLPEGQDLYNKTISLKENNPDLKIILSVGGWEFGSILFSEMVATPASRAIFIESTLKLLHQHNFDGLDLDWEYPADRGGKPEDKQNFAALVQELHEAFDVDPVPKGKNRLLLTAAISAGKKDEAYDYTILAKNLDFITLMTFDYVVFESGDNVTAHHSSLYSRRGAKELEAQLNVAWTVDYWLSKDVPPEKLLISLPFYGRSYILESSNNTGVGAPAYFSGLPGPFLNNPEGMYAYYEICMFMKANRTAWRTIIDPETRVPYSHNSSYWIAYDNEDSIKEKMEYVRMKHLGGVMIWSIDQDDFGGMCTDGRDKFPLLHTVNEFLLGSQTNVKYTQGHHNTYFRNTASSFQPALQYDENFLKYFTLIFIQLCLYF